MTARFEGRRVLMTGGASGIGRAAAVRFVAEGATVFAVDLDEEGLARTVSECAGPGRITTAVCDVTSEPEVVATVARAGSDLGGLDVLANVAGIHRTTPIESLTVDDLHLLFEVNLVGTALTCREAVPHLGRGSVIVNVASSAAAHGNPYMSAYSASKGAVLAFSLSLAAELVGRGIRVVPVSPGTVATPLTAAVVPGDLDFGYFGRIRSLMGEATPEQIAGAIAFAASDDASYLTGAELRVDGGSHI
ncbi:MAG TPA: SDR family oxidoreductase [Nocardioides sp.]|uniref:SDR family NAD(P)-dependent oxidoreductase n=1 Tax=Nocardioides sp. TaxID=35761 RepID=UPI002CF6D5CE|nr:SDR family oxidoreductase [Nocardioides sp.]HTW18421.1 SDR family oxidoreductase [Nocardioides sp.]